MEYYYCNFHKEEYRNTRIGKLTSYEIVIVILLFVY